MCYIPLKIYDCLANISPYSRNVCYIVSQRSIERCEQNKSIDKNHPTLYEQNMRVENVFMIYYGGGVDARYGKG